MAKKVAVIIMKGGVGKSTLCVNLRGTSRQWRPGIREYYSWIWIRNSMQVNICLVFSVMKLKFIEPIDRLYGISSSKRPGGYTAHLRGVTYGCAPTFPATWITASPHGTRHAASWPSCKQPATAFQDRVSVCRRCPVRQLHGEQPGCDHGDRNQNRPGFQPGLFLCQAMGLCGSGSFGGGIDDEFAELDRIARAT